MRLKLKCFNISNLCSKSNGEKKNSFCQELKLIYYTFFYNEQNDALGLVETLLYPFVDCFSQFMRYIGWFLVSLVIVLVLNMIYIFYAIILPEIYMTSWFNFLVHFSLGNWLAVNTVFHYYMGLTTNPGYPPSSNVENVATICKKCIAPKPARTHHCSICQKCILKMDHHCPWFNNCIGFYNHRYFLLFCVFLTIDCVYLSTFGFYYYQLYVYPSMDLNIFKFLINSPSNNSQYAFYYQLSSIEFFLAFVAGFAVLGLASINIYIISHGATNIELRSMRIPCAPSTYEYAKNPYDLGFVTNWKAFLGFKDFRSFFFKVILPSTHKPLGDGIDWSAYFNFSQNENSFFRYEILQV